MDLTPISIDRSEALSVERPSSVESLSGLIAHARQSHRGVYPVGGRTTLDVGLPPLKPGIALDTTGLDRVIDYPARDMTITAQAGITMARLQAELAKEGQWLPIDVAEPEKATLGGAIALNQSGPHRYGSGTLRDYVIGISFATDEGVEVKAGGRVVKNVAGYDLMKLQIGAVGSLGVVTQATLKVKPRPESREVVAFSCGEDELDRVLNRLHDSRTRPAFVELLTDQTWQLLPSSVELLLHCHWVFAVGFEEKAATVQWQLATLLDEVKGMVADESVIPLGHFLTSEITALQTRAESRFISKISVRPSQVRECVQAIAKADPDALIHAHALNGIVWTHSQTALASHPHSIARRCPPELKKTRPVWGEPGNDWNLMRHIKNTLDPDNVFNPGRLFGDL